MNLKLLIYKARLNGIPVYCLILFLLYASLNYLHSKPIQIDFVPKHLISYVMFKEKFKFPTTKLTDKAITKLTGMIELLNYEREVYRTQRYGLVRPDTTILVVQVGRDVERLQYLIVSLAQVQHIQSALVVFSHSFFDDKMNKLVRSITFCRFMQIFYPYSLQLYPNKFPGIDPEDCKSSVGRTDKYCSNRDARLTEYKHHWWWKACFIFNNMDWSDTHKGPVVFLEEDNYVLPDMLYMLRYASRSLALIQGIQIMSFGRPYAKGLDYNLLTVESWRPPYDKGIAFNRTVWQKIVAASSYYCMYDDISWSYSMLNVFSRFRGGHSDMVAVMAPRVLSTSMFPSGYVAVQKIHRWMKDAMLFPVDVKAVSLYSSSGRVNTGAKPPPRGNGGWGDLRDHLLCLDPLMSTTTGPPNEQTETTPSSTGEPQQYLPVAKPKANLSKVNVSI